MVAVVAFEFSVMRCQPLRRALCCAQKKVVFRFIRSPHVSK
ncbi:acetyltransferase [Vibrio mimicus]|nr:acetyltransferase [Vibrio mimicus]